MGLDEDEDLINWALCIPKNHVGDQHLIPNNDTREHDLNEHCWCEPEEDEGPHGPMLKHNSADGRERYEEGYRLPH